MLVGDKVHLVPLDRANAEKARHWVNDPEINRWMLSGHIPVSVEGEEAYYAGAEKDQANKTGFAFEIHAIDGPRYIGNCGLHKVDLIHRHAEVGILIGQIMDHNKGYGRDAIRTLLKFGFETLGLHSIEIRHMAPNEAGAHLYRSIGFKEVGTLRQHCFLHGEWVDEVVLDMLAEDWAHLR